MRESGDREDMATAILTAASTSAKLLVDTSVLLFTEGGMCCYLTLVFVDWRERAVDR